MHRKDLQDWYVYAPTSPEVILHQNQIGYGKGYGQAARADDSSFGVQLPHVSKIAE